MRRKQKPSEKDELEAVPKPLRSFLEIAQSWLTELRSGLKDSVIQFIQQNSSVLLVALFSLVKATGITIKSGQTGLLYSFGRTKQELSPGFRLLIPFLQVVRTMPTRQRTLDLPAQRVTTRDGLVYFVDANIVFRVVDVRKALVEIDDLIKGMRQVLVLSVQVVLRNSDRESLRKTSAIDLKLSESMATLLEPWGVELIHAGFTSITPSPATLKLVQLGARVGTRHENLTLLTRSVPQKLALPLLGTHQRVITKSRVLFEREVKRRRVRLVRRVLRTEIRRAGTKLSSKERSQLARYVRVQAGIGRM